MASEISWRSEDTGSTVYCTIRSAARTYWNGTALEALTVANWANYDVALTETPASSYFYAGDWPAALTTVGWYWLDIYSQAGETPAIDDTMLGTIVGYWNGTTFGPWAADVEQWKGATAPDAPPTAEAVAAEIKTAMEAEGSHLALILARVGAFTGTGINTVLGFFRALMSKDASTPSDVGGTFSAEEDSIEALSDVSIKIGGTYRHTNVTVGGEYTGETEDVEITEP